MENKNSFFSLYLEVFEKKDNSYYLEQLDNSVDLILATMGVKTTSYKFKQKSGNEIIYFFKTETRKRKGQLIKLCEKNLSPEQVYKTEGLTKTVFNTEIERFMRNENFTTLEKPSLFGEYEGDDIAIFNDPKKWHAWQKDVYSSIFNKDESFKKPDTRKIISLVDKKGNSGKSSFFKWLYFKHAEDIGRIGYGSASQLRSSAVNIGKKKLYIIDLARSKSRDDKEEDLLSVLEDLKSGLIVNAMYGSGRTLMMEPPHILVSSNYVLNYDLLSEDRWDVYQITRSNKLKTLDPKSERKLLKVKK